MHDIRSLKLLDVSVIRCDTRRMRRPGFLRAGRSLCPRRSRCSFSRLSTRRGSTVTARPAPTVSTRVLFVGHDGSSPQIAASLLRRVAGDRVVVHTASTRPADPGGRSDELLVAMGLNPADSQRLSARALHIADRVVVLGTGLDVAQLPGPRYEEWDLADVDLSDRIQTLSSELDNVPQGQFRSAGLNRLWM